MRTNLPSDLRLHEEVMLLACREESGTFATESTLTYAFGAALLAELLLLERIRVEGESKRKERVRAIASEPIGVPLLDEVLEKIQGAKKPATLQAWVTRIAGTKKLRDRIAAPLCQQNILKQSERRVLFFFTQQVYRLVDHNPKKELIERLRQAIASEKPSIEPRTAILLSLANSADVLKNVFDPRWLKEHKPRIKQVVNGEMTGAAAKEAIDAMQAALIVAAVIPAVVVATTPSPK